MITNIRKRSLGKLSIAIDNENFMRTRLLVAFTYCFLSSPIQAQDIHPEQKERPNIVLIVSNGHGMDDLGCYGNPNIKTPNLDNLASEGVKFLNAYSASPSDGPSHATILTGLFAHANGQYGPFYGNSHFSVFPEVKSLPFYLKASGYRTARAGLFPLAPLEVFPFDTVLGMAVNPRNAYEMAEQCTRFLARKDSMPFFLYFCPGDPGRSNDATDEDPGAPNRFGNKNHGYEGIIPTYYKPGKIVLPPYLPDSKECREEFAQYAQAVSRLDLGLGRLFHILKKLGLWDNTLVMYTSACGPAFPGAQTTLYEPGIKIPCIVKLPFEKPLITASDAMLNSVDLLPTILGYSSATPSEHIFHGRSFSEVMAQEHPQGWNEIFATHTFHEITRYYPMRAVTGRRYKLIWNVAWQLPFPITNDLLNAAVWQETLKSGNHIYGKRLIRDFIQRPDFELYDIIDDPGETRNLASNPEYSAILEEYKNKLKAYQIKTNDPWITSWVP